MTSPTGEVQLSQRFTPFGEVKEKFGDGEADFGYTAQKFDAQTGLLYLRARYYAPGTGRFISHDTWSGDANMPMSYNAWLYVNGNPVRYVDPSGHKQVITTETVRIWDYDNLPWGGDGLLDPNDLPTATLFVYEYTELGIKVYKLPNRNGKFNRNASRAYLGYYEMVKDYGNIDASGYPFHVRTLSQLEQMDINASQMKAWNWGEAGISAVTDVILVGKIVVVIKAGGSIIKVGSSVCMEIFDPSIKEMKDIPGAINSTIGIGEAAISDESIGSRMLDLLKSLTPIIGTGYAISDAINYQYPYEFDDNEYDAFYREKHTVDYY